MKIWDLKSNCIFYLKCGRDYTWKCKGKEMMNINELYDAVDQCKAEGVKDPFVSLK